jgi:glucosylceramidase
VARLSSTLATVTTGGLILSLLAPGTTDVRAANEAVSVWVTTSDRSQLLQPQAPIAFGADGGSHPTTVDVDEAVRFQTIDGFGASLTDSSAWLIANRMTSSQRAVLLNNLFTTAGTGIGLSILRQPMGASDFALGNYNYDDTCCDLSDFSIQYEMPYVVPVLKQIRAINPNVLLMGSPWSAPGWMKTTGRMNGGSLQYAYYKTHAQYFVKWIQAYQAQGLPIWAVTPQNEPMYDTTGYPTMRMEAGDQASFVKNDLGPAIRDAGLATKIVAFDHNWSLGIYPATVLGDPAAKAFAAGTGFHCYGGNMSAQTTLHNAHPDRDIWHTECSDGTWIGGGAFAALFDRNMREMAIGVLRHWAKGTIKWNLALDTNNGPTNGGCTTCHGTVTINQANGAVTYNAEYYALGHASKFVRRGAHRIASNTFAGGIENVAFRNADGSKVLVAYNSATAAAAFKVRWAGQSFTYTLPGRAAATFTWANTVVTPSPTPTSTPTATPSGISTTAWYQVVNQTSGKCVDDAGWGTANGAAVQQWTCGTAQANQQWQLQTTSGGYYRVVNRHAPSLAWDVAGGASATANGALIQLWTYGGGNNQQWLPQAAAGYYRMVARHSGRCLDVREASTANGARLQQYDCNGTAAQSFRLVAVP